MSRGRRGFTIPELLLAIAMTSALGLGAAVILKGSAVSWQKTSGMVDFLTNARRAMRGEGRTSGMVRDIMGAAEIVSLSSTTLTLQDPLGVQTIYSLSPKGELLWTQGASTKIRAKGLSELSFRYFERTPNFQIVESTTPASVRLVTVSFKMSRLGRTVTFLSGARLRNQE